MDLPVNGIPRFNREFRDYCSMRVVLGGLTYNICVTDGGRLFMHNVKTNKWDDAPREYVGRFLALIHTMGTKIAETYGKKKGVQ